MNADSLAFNIQHPTPDDLERVFNFMLECDIAEFGEADSDKDDLIDQWSEADLAADAWIASNQAGDITGYALLSDEFNGRRYLDLYLHTGRSPQGLAEALLDQAVERFTSLVKAGSSASDCILTAYANGLNPGIRTAYESHGFTVEKFHYRMQMDFSAPYPAPVWPAGFTLAPVTPAEEKDLHALIISAFDWQGIRSHLQTGTNRSSAAGGTTPSFFSCCTKRANWWAPPFVTMRIRASGSKSWPSQRNFRGRASVRCS